MKKARLPARTKPTGAPVRPGGLLTDVRDLILAARQTVARGVNSTLVVMYWKIGERIRKDILQEKRAQYGEEILQTLSAKLALVFGRGFGEKNLRRMVQLAEQFPDSKIVAALLRQLGWTHFTLLLPIKDPLKRDFYAEMCRIENWSTRTLAKKIGGLLVFRSRWTNKAVDLRATPATFLAADPSSLCSSEHAQFWRVFSFPPITLIP